MLRFFAAGLGAGKYCTGCKMSIDPLFGLLSGHRLHLQIVLGPLALMPTMFTWFLHFTANAHVPWLAKRLGSLWNNVAIAFGMRIHHARQKPRTR